MPSEMPKIGDIVVVRYDDGEVLGKVYDIDGTCIYYNYISGNDEECSADEDLECYVYDIIRIISKDLPKNHKQIKKRIKSMSLKLNKILKQRNKLSVQIIDLKAKIGQY